MVIYINPLSRLSPNEFNKLLDEDEKFQEFLGIKNIKPATIDGYKIKLKEYCQAIGLTPTELINEAYEQEENGIRLKKREIKSYLMRFVQHLQEKEYKETSINNYLIYVKAFYSAFEIELPKIPIKLNETPKQDYKEFLEKEDIINALKHANPKYKAIIILMASNGMGSAEIRSLKFADFLKSIEKYFKYPLREPYKVNDIRATLPTNEHIIPTWHVERIKTGEPYFTFSSPESVEAILDYLEHREAKGKIISGVDEPLFIGVESKTPLKEVAFAKAFATINDEAGFGRMNGRRYFTSHKLRKFFSDKAYKSGIDERRVKWMRGQKLDNSDAFTRHTAADPHDLEVEYINKALPYLSIERLEVREIEPGEIKTLKKNLESKEDMIQDQDARIRELEKQMLILMDEKEGQPTTPQGKTATQQIFSEKT